MCKFILCCSGRVRFEVRCFGFIVGVFIYFVLLFYKVRIYYFLIRNKGEGVLCFDSGRNIEV